VNRVFLTGTIRDKIRVRYTPQGRRILLFPLLVDEEGFTIEVLYKVPEGGVDYAEKAKGKVMIAGTLTKAGEKPDQFFRLKANKIMLMEE
jgi:hypothetical protein